MALPSTIKVGSLVLSLQSFVVAAAGLLVGLVLFFMLPSIATAVASLVITGIFFLYAYNINCVVVGQCSIFSWILTAFYLLLACVQIIKIMSEQQTPSDIVSLKKDIAEASPVKSLSQVDKLPIVDSLKRSVSRIASPKKA